MDLSAVNIGGTTIHSCLGIDSGTKLLGLHNKYKIALRKGLSKVKCLIIDELSLVSSDLWTDIDSRLREILMVIPEKASDDLSVMTVADFLHESPVRGKLTFSQFFDKHSVKRI